MYQEKKIEISDLSGKHYVVISSVENNIDFVSKSTRVRVSFGGIENEFFAELIAACQKNSYMINIPVPAGAGSATVVLATELQNYDLRKIIAFASDMEPQFN